MINTIIVNKTNEIIASVTYTDTNHLHVLYEQQGSQIEAYYDNIDELLNNAQETDTEIYYLVNGSRIPVNHTTHNKKHYFNWQGHWKFTPAEAVIYGILQEKTETQNRWISTQQIKNVLTAFGFKPTSFRELLHRIRKKTADSSIKIEYKNKGYRIVETNNIKYKSSMKQNHDNSDYKILLKDRKVNIFASYNFEKHIHSTKHTTGGQILKGYQGLTHTESEIYFELIKFRNEWLTYKYLLELPWAIKKTKEKNSNKYRLHNFISKIRKKIRHTDETIQNKTLCGYRLLH